MAAMTALSLSSAAAAASLSSSTNSQLSSCNGGMFCPAQVLALVPSKSNGSSRKKQSAKIVCQAANIAADRVPDMDKRKLMNLLLLGTLALPISGILGPYALVFVPPQSGGTGGGLVAKDAIGNDIKASEWLKIHPPGDKTLAQGLKGDPTYIVIENDGQLATYGLNAVCTHLGCVVPWIPAENKFICPCHGSQYNNQGKVVRGPAPLSLALAHVDITDDTIVLVPWTETDFRTGDDPWWS